MTHFREKLRHREAFAMRADVDILALLCETPPPPEVVDGVGLLYVRGPIDHHKNPLGVGCSYEQTIEWFHELNGDPQVTAILMVVDSPGGLVSGLNATVRALRKAKSKPVYAISDEMATSAAYAISCVADEIIATPSAVTGSIGVISTMCSQARADKAMGLDFVTITSGERKADGHPHMPIEGDAVEVEAERVDELAGQFYALVEESRGLDPGFIQALEAGIFLGAEALDLGLVDEVMDVDEAIASIAMAHSGTISLAQRNSSGSGGVTPPEASMLSAKAQIANLTRKMAASTSKKERASLAAQITKKLAALPRAETTKKWEKHESEEETTSDEDEEEEGGNETDREEESDEDKKEASRSEEEESAESDEDKKEAMSAEGDDDKDKDEKKESKKASAELAALRAEVAELRKVNAARSRADEATARTTKIEAALRSKRITPAEAKTLAKKDGEYIAAFLEARPKAVILTAEEALRPLPAAFGNVMDIARASGGGAPAHVDLTVEQEKMLADVADPKIREAIVKKWTAQVAAKESVR